MVVCGGETTKIAHMMHETKEGDPQKLARWSQERNTIQARRVQSTNTYLSLPPPFRLITTHNADALLYLFRPIGQSVVVPCVSACKLNVECADYIIKHAAL